MVNKQGTPKVVHYHYFFPCWDIDLFFQDFSDHRIISIAYAYDPRILQNPKKLRNLKNNLDLWC